MVTLTPQFESSYRQFQSYPENLFDRHSSLPTLRAYTKRLNGASDKLFVQDEDLVDVPFRDLDGAGNVLVRRNVFNDQKLRDLLGDTAQEDPQTKAIISGSYATKIDPKCRFIFLWAKHSRAPLKITRRMLERIMSYHQVMPRYLEFLFLFGQRSIPHDLRYSGFREQCSLDRPASGQNMPLLGRGGRQYQMCYNLKTVGCSSDAGFHPKPEDYSIRHAAIYHQFDVEYGTTLWIITKGGLELKEQVQETTGADGRPEDRSFSTPEESFRASLSIQIMLAHWATDDWRWYIQSLEDTVHEETQDTVQGDRSNSTIRKEYRPKDLQKIQVWEEKANEAVTIIDANASVLIAIDEFYSSLPTKPGFPLGSSNADDINDFVSQMKDLVADYKMQSTRAKLLVQIASQRKQLILQYLQSQATDQMATLSVMAQKEAVAVRIITVVTLIYLPATFVSTFYSTDVVKYQNQSDGKGGSSNNVTSFSALAMFRWLEVTLPLTFVTLGLSWLFYQKAKEHLGLRLMAQKLRNVPLVPEKRSGEFSEC